MWIRRVEPHVFLGIPRSTDVFYIEEEGHKWVQSENIGSEDVKCCNVYQKGMKSGNESSDLTSWLFIFNALIFSFAIITICYFKKSFKCFINKCAD